MVENGFAHQPVYVRRFFRRELGFAEIAIVFNLAELSSAGFGLCRAGREARSSKRRLIIL